MAERLGTALQKLLQRFESASDLTKTALERNSNAVFLLFAYVNCGAKAHSVPYKISFKRPIKP